MIHPNTEVRFINDNIGLGLFSTSFIPKGTITWVKDPLDRVLSPDEIKSLPETLTSNMMKYAYRNAKGHYVLCWDFNRFMNHSFTPNVMITPYDLEIAIQDIPAGTELREDYGCLNIIEAFEPDPEAGSSRQVVRPDDLLHYHQTWDEILSAVFPSVSKVKQPLQSLLNAPQWKKICQIADGKEMPDSILKCYYSECKTS